MQRNESLTSPPKNKRIKLLNQVADETREREREREVSDTHISWLETKSTSVFVLVLFEDVPKQDAFRIITSLAVNTPRGHVVC